MKLTPGLRGCALAVLLGACGNSSGDAADAELSPEDGGTLATDAAGSQPDGGNPQPDGAPGIDSGGTPSPTMTFFVSSTGNGAAGGNYGGLAGADAHCQSLAQAVGAGRHTWHAYLSTSERPGYPGGNVNARDRIGAGPWFNAAGVEVAASVTALHATPIDWQAMLDEHGDTVPRTEHDILTGSDENGWREDADPYSGNPTAACKNWSSNDPGDVAIVGHYNWNAPFDVGPRSWVNAHTSDCSQAGFASHGGATRIYCFAIDP